MNKACAIIGANYGDEGKGLMTDFIVHKNKSASVVRYNGGAQAGHTVILEDGTRHVFHHLGSGTFAGASTILSKEFILNPILFRKEYEEFVRTKGITPVVFVDKRCRVSTPWDMAFNQMEEKIIRHGSCGVGINATVDRSQHIPLQLTNVGYGELWEIFGYHKARLLKADDFFDRSKFTGMVDKFLADVAFMLAHTLPFEQLEKDAHIVFEGAQGLALDEYYGSYPNVTRSRTGLPYIIDFCREYNVALEEVIYVTRSYLTRHGNGDFPGGNDIFFEDKTNKPNEWQGTMRMKEFTPATVEDMVKRVELDVSSVRYDGKHTLAVTHCNEVPFPSVYDCFVGYRSSSPSREGVVCLT